MATIQEENLKPIREHLDVRCGIDISFASIDSIEAEGAYFIGDINQEEPKPVLMDLSNGGFYTDGLAVPLDDDVDGILANIGEDLVITLTLDDAVDADENIVVYGYVGEELKKWTFSTVQGTMQTFTIPRSEKRVWVRRITVGHSWWFDNTTLISVNGVLRGTETKIDNPELQISEIEIKGYEPNDITKDIGKIGEDYPIYYYSGYRGDMSTPRKFYMSDQIEWEDNVITIKGQDATKYLDKDYAGIYQVVDTGHAPNVLYNHIKNGIERVFSEHNINLNVLDDIPVSTEGINTNLLIDDSSVRKLISYYSGIYWMGISYIDAGSPTLFSDINNTPVYEIYENQYGELKTETDKDYNKITATLFNTQLSSSEELHNEDVTVGQEFWVNSTEPIVNWTCSNNLTKTYESLHSACFKVTSNGTGIVSGQKVIKYYTSNNNPFTYSENRLGSTMDYGDVPILTEEATQGALTLKVASVPEYPKIGNIKYTFTYRGNPNIQPRNAVILHKGEEVIYALVESIQFMHENGGFKQSIVARRLEV